MKKLLSIMLAMVMSLSAAGGLAMAEEAVPTTSSDIGGWARVDSKNTDAALYDTVNLVEDETYGTVVEVIKQSESISESRLGIRQTIPSSKLVEGHTYVLDFKYKMENLSNTYWLRAGFSSWDGTYLTQPCDDEVGDKGWRSGSKSVTYSSSTFSSGLPVWIFTSNAQAHFWIADVAVYDAADENKTNLIENGAFDKSAADYEMTADADSTPGWTIGTCTSMTVKRVFNPLTGSWSAKITNDGSGQKNISILKYTVPKSMLTEGHTYKLSMYVKTENLSNKGYIYFAGGEKKTTDTFAPNYKSGRTSNVTGANLYKSNTISFGHDTAVKDIIYADNLVITDETTGEILDLKNTDFEHMGAEYVEDVDSLNMPGWTARTASTTASINRVYDFKTGSYAAKITNNGTGNSWNTLAYTIPKSKLAEGHTYTVQAYLRCEGFTSDSQWVALDWGGITSNTPWVKNLTNGSNHKITGINLYSNNKVTFGFTHAPAGSLYVDNLVITDETTGETLALENPDFETIIDSSVEFIENGGMCTASIVSKKQTYKIMMVSAIYSGNKLLSLEKYDYDVEAKPEVQEFNMNVDVFGDGFTTRAFLWNAETFEPLAPHIDVE